MATTKTSSFNPESICIKGLSRLVKAIVDSKTSNKTPIVLTISRRMPHILFWYKNTYASEEQKRILDETEIITEIALPFINFKNKQNFEIFIVDDVVSSGRTIRYVMNLTEIMSMKEVSKVFVLFCDSYSPFLLINDEDRIIFGNKFSGEKEKSQIVDFITTIIAATLPIDVTYPIIYFEHYSSELTINEIYCHFRDSQGKGSDNYEIKIKFRSSLKFGNNKVNKGDCNVTYSSLLPSAISNSLNNDFAKIRTYHRLKSFIVVPYAPNILTDDNLRNRDLFEAPEYKKIWNVVLDKVNPLYFEAYSSFDDDSYVKELRMNRSYRSLVSVANYLYSVSLFNKIAKEREEDTNDMENKLGAYYIKQEDLNLIIGNDLSLLLMPQIENILNKKIVSPRTHKKINVPSTFIPNIYEQDYTVSKYLSIPIAESDLQTKLKAIFQNASDKRDEYYAFMIEDIEYGVEGIMESFEALENALHVKTQEEKEEINKWVDERIDNAEIVSRYACVKDEQGLRYWRRFFRISSSLVH